MTPSVPNGEGRLTHMRMAIRNWSARRLVIAWMVGLAVEGGLVGALIARNRDVERQLEEQRASFFGHARPATPAERDSMLRLLRDRYGVTLSVHGDTITGVELSPEAEQRVRTAAAGISSALGAAVVIGSLIWTVVYLTIPAVLAWATVVWVRARKRARPEGVAAPPS